MNKKFFHQNKSKQEGGFVLIFLAIALTAIIAFLALTVDGYRLSTSHSQERSVAQQAAMAALERYRESTPPTGLTPRSEYEYRFQKAVLRAEEVAGLQSNTLLGNPGTKLANTGDLTSNAAGTITAGTYFFEEPNGPGGCTLYNSDGKRNSPVNHCPCGNPVSVSGWKSPCFLENDASSVDATAFDVQLKTKASSPLPFLFGKAIGYPNKEVQAPGRSAILPRHGVYAVDMSGSMAAETHLSFSNLSAADRYKSSEYVFQITGTTLCSSTGAANPCTAAASGCVFAGDPNAANIWYTQMQQQRPASGLQPKWRHYRSDYTCEILDLDNDGTDEHYLIDTHTHNYDDNGDAVADGFYRGPEPLSNILVGIHQALTTIEQRQVAGDQIAVFAFDQAVLDKRPNLGRVFGYTHPGLTTFDNLKTITEVPSSGDAKASSVATRLNAGFFPRPAANTDIPEAVIKAADLLSEMPNNTSAQSYVAMFTDGLTTCRHECGDSDGGTGECTSPWWSLFLYKDSTNHVKLAKDSCNTPPDPAFDHRKSSVNEGGGPYANGTGWWWGSSWNYHANSLAEVTALIAGNRTEYPDEHYFWMTQAGYPSYVDKSITFHAVVFGQLAQPHTVLRQGINDSSKCMDEADARKNGSTFTWNDWDDYFFYNRNCYETLQQSGSDSCPYVEHVYEIYRHWVKPTGGYFVPIRPSCASPALQSAFGIDNNQCRAGALRTALDGLCASKGPYPGGPVRDPKLTAAGLVDDRSGKNFYGPGSNEYTSVKDSDVANRPPRIICDTSCRTTEEQITEFVRNIYAQSPYILVARE